MLIINLPTQSQEMEILLGHTLNINPHLSTTQLHELIAMLRDYKVVFAWAYQDMCGIHPNTCIHHMYIEEGSHLVRQPQRRINPILCEIVMEELQNLLNVGFINPILDSQWVSLLVVVLKRNGKW